MKLLLDILAWIIVVAWCLVTLPLLPPYLVISWAIERVT
jgi:hypothetical protein